MQKFGTDNVYKRLAWFFIFEVLIVIFRRLQAERKRPTDVSRLTRAATIKAREKREALVRVSTDERYAMSVKARRASVKIARNQFERTVKAEALRTLKVAAADPWDGFYGVKTGSGKYTLGVRPPIKANPDGSPKIKITGKNPETGLPTWDWDYDCRDRDYVPVMEEKGREERKVERKQKALAKARAATVKGRRERYASGTETLMDRVEVIRVVSKLETLPHEAAGALDNLRALQS